MDLSSGMKTTNLLILQLRPNRHRHLAQRIPIFCITLLNREHRAVNDLEGARQIRYRLNKILRLEIL